MTGESVEQAALRRGDETGWAGRARREATAVLAEASATRRHCGAVTYDDLVMLCAISWLQGVNFGSHETLSSAERAFDRMRDAL